MIITMFSVRYLIILLNLQKYKARERDATKHQLGSYRKSIREKKTI